MQIALESIIIAIIALLDLIVSVIAIYMGHDAQEGNILMRGYFENIYLLVSVKLLCIFGPIFILEYARRHSPVFTRWMSRLCIVIYIISIVSYVYATCFRGM